MRQRIVWMIIASALISLPLLATQAAASDRRPVEGPYIGAFAGLIVLDSTVVFPATSTRPAAKFVDQGGDGIAFGLRAGWGRLVGENTYVGIELEGILPHNATSRLMAAGMEYRARLRSEVGLYGRLGWSPDGRNLIYTRFGLTVPKQNYQSVREPANARAEWTPVPTIGVGHEIALTDRVSTRVDVTYSFPNGPNILESYRMTLGLTYRF